MALLSRTADNLFWTARYVERAESVARTLDAANRLSSLPIANNDSSTEWTSALAVADCQATFFEIHATPSFETVVDHLGFSHANPSSIRRCLETARANARAERTALTLEMWESINETYFALQSWTGRPVSQSDLAGFIGFVKEASLRFDGSASRTMLRNDAFWFEQLGMYIERADNTARILDVKYHILLPTYASVGGGLDYYQWAAILRAVSALTSYRWVYRTGVKPWLVADLLILQDAMPRSLINSCGCISRFLDDIAAAYGRQGASQRLARRLHLRLRNLTIDSIFQSGLHEFIEEFRGELFMLANAVTDQYLS